MLFFQPDVETGMAVEHHKGFYPEYITRYSARGNEGPDQHLV